MAQEITQLAKSKDSTRYITSANVAPALRLMSGNANLAENMVTCGAFFNDALKHADRDNKRFEKVGINFDLHAGDVSIFTDKPLTSADEIIVLTALNNGLREFEKHLAEQAAGPVNSASSPEETRHTLEALAKCTLRVQGAGSYGVVISAAGTDQPFSLHAVEDTLHALDLPEAYKALITQRIRDVGSNQAFLGAVYMGPPLPNVVVSEINKALDKAPALRS